jgi:hypothetical protein
MPLDMAYLHSKRKGIVQDLDEQKDIIAELMSDDNADEDEDNNDNDNA